MIGALSFYFVLSLFFISPLCMQCLFVYYDVLFVRACEGNYDRTTKGINNLDTFFFGFFFMKKVTQRYQYERISYIKMIAVDKYAAFLVNVNVYYVV